MNWKLIETNPPPVGKHSWDKILCCFEGPQFHQWVYFTCFPNGKETKADGYAKPTHWCNVIPPNTAKR